MAIIKGKDLRVVVESGSSDVFPELNSPLMDSIKSNYERPDAITATVRFEPVMRPRLFINHEMWAGVQGLLAEEDLRGAAWFRQAICELLPFNLGPQIIQHGLVHVIVNDEFVDPVLEVPEPLTGAFGRSSTDEED